ncbi:MAG TPA: MATE family efflux transporter [Bacteroidia bacterium]|nr:MATE family efflux transporter [Bacteroidia bacterium]HNT80343.1 MATE family efflux transporter [Bacteroidia bacterium]
MQIGSSYSDILKVAFPIIVASLVHTIIGITDIIFLGNLGDVQLGAASLGMLFYFVIYMIGVGLGTGYQISIARRSGEGNHSSIGLIHDSGWLVFALYAIVGFLILVLSSFYLMPLLIDDEELSSLSLEYIFHRSWGIFFATAIIVYRSFYTGIARTNIITYASLIMALSNIALNYVLIYGFYGFPAWGVKGAAIASNISELLAAAIFFCYTLLRKNNSKYKLFAFSNMKREINLQLLSLSSPVIIQNVLSMGSWFIFFLLIEKLGSLELAISNVVRSIYMIAMVPVWGFALAANSMVSNLLGQNLKSQVFILIRKTAIVSFAITSILILLSLYFDRQLLSIATNSENVVDGSITILRIVGLASICISVSNVLILSVSGTGATKMALLIEVICISIYLGYLFYCHTTKAGLKAMWYSEIIYWISIGLFSYMYLRSGKWSNKTI